MINNFISRWKFIIFLKCPNYQTAVYPTRGFHVRALRNPPPPLQDPPLSRYDYEKVDAAAADKMVERLNAFIADKTSIGKEFTAAGKTFKVAKAEDFEYVDPIDKSVAKKQVETSLLVLCG